MGLGYFYWSMEYPMNETISKTQTLSVESIDVCVAPHCHGHVFLMPANETLTFLVLVNG